MLYTSRGLSRRRGTDKWEAVFSHTDPLTKKKVRKCFTIEARTEAAARKERDKLLQRLNQEGEAVASKMTVSDLVDELIEHKEKSGGLEESTLYYYRKDANVIARYIGSMCVGDLDIPQVDDWIAQMSEDGLAPRTIAKPYRLLNQAIKFGIARDLLKKNPCDFCKPPKIERKKVQVLDKAERKRMLNLVLASLEIPLHCAVALALTTGLRREEICGLRFSDLNEDGTISINRALGRREGGYYEKSPKNEASRRKVPLIDVLYTHFKNLSDSLKKTEENFAIKLGDPYILGTHELESRPYQPAKLSRDFCAFVKTHGFRKVTFHDLRHVFASLLVGEGSDISTVASILGHASVSETLNTYAEANPEAKRAAKDKILSAFDIDQPQFAFQIESHQDEPSGITFTVEQLRAMLKVAEQAEASNK